MPCHVEGGSHHMDGYNGSSGKLCIVYRFPAIIFGFDGFNQFLTLSDKSPLLKQWVLDLSVLAGV